MRQHCESEARIAAPAAELFAFLDDPANLTAHMEKPSWAMAGGSMHLTLDEGGGRAVGSRMGLAGNVLGMRLSLEEEVIEREPPHRKAWQTIGSPRLLVIGPYRMGFEVSPDGEASRVRVYVDYALPPRLRPRWLAAALGRMYARWCAERMVAEAAHHFARSRRVDEHQGGVHQR